MIEKYLEWLQNNESLFPMDSIQKTKSTVLRVPYPEDYEDDENILSDTLTEFLS